MEDRFTPGDLVHFSGTGDFAAGIDAIVMEVDADGKILKLKAAKPDPRLARMGWFQEGDNYVSMVHTIISPN